MRPVAAIALCAVMALPALADDVTEVDRHLAWSIAGASGKKLQNIKRKTAELQSGETVKVLLVGLEDVTVRLVKARGVASAKSGPKTHRMAKGVAAARTTETAPAATPTAQIAFRMKRSWASRSGMPATRGSSVPWSS